MSSSPPPTPPQEPTPSAARQQSASRWPSSIAALEIQQYRWLLASNAAFFLAMQGQMLTRTFLAWRLTGEEMSLAYINIAFAIPMLLFSLVGGALSDRLERRNLVLWGQSLLVLNESLVLFLLLTDTLEFWHLLFAGAVGGMVIPIIMPARTAIVYRQVGPSLLGNAMALSSAVINVSRVIGPALMGFAISLYTVSGAYFVAVLLFIVSLLCMTRVDKDYPASQSTNNTRLSRDVLEGLQYVAAHRALLTCLLFGLIPMFLAMPFQNLLVLFADEVWHVGEQGLGLLMGACGLGGILGSAWVANRGENTRRIRWIAFNTLCFGALLMVFSFTPSFYLALIPLVLANACASASQTMNHTVLQLLVDDEQRGRLSALSMMTFGLTPLGVLPLAYLAQSIGAPWTTFLACALLILTVIVFYTFSSTLKRLDQHVEKALH